MKIDIRSLTKCTVVNGGDAIILGLVDRQGRPFDLRVSVADASALAMTLPRLLRESIKEKFKDDSLRYVFPLEKWQLEAASDGSHIIMTLATASGFEVSFSLNAVTYSLLGAALGRGPEHLSKTPLAN